MRECVWIMKNYKPNTGLTIIPSSLLPPATMYVSMDIFKEFEKCTKSNKSMLDRLKELYENDNGK